jgi:septum formation protein
VVLASASPRRREILARLGLAFETRSPDVEEETVRGSAGVVVSVLARAKAERVLGLLLEAREDAARPASWLVLGADTVVALEGESGAASGAGGILGKPRDAAHAREMLRSLAGRRHRVWTGLALARPGERTRVETEVTEVRFRPLLDAEIDAYAATGEPLGKAGAYAIQGRGAALVETIRGCYWNVVGLPLRRAAALLEIAAPGCDCGAFPFQRGWTGCGRPFAPPTRPDLGPCTAGRPGASEPPRDS